MTKTSKTPPALRVPSGFHLGALSATIGLMLAPILWVLAAIVYEKISGGKGAAGGVAMVVAMLAGPLSWLLGLASIAPMVSSRPRKQSAPEGLEPLAFFRSQVDTLALRVRKTWRAAAALALVTLFAGGLQFFTGSQLPKDGLLLSILIVASTWALVPVPILVVSTGIVAGVYQLVLLRAKRQLSALEAAAPAAQAEKAPVEPAEQ